MPLLTSLFAAGLCAKGTVLAIIAHADDDLYFINPDIQAAISDDYCVHTLVTTSGYFGNPDNQKRVSGLQLAYAAMHYNQIVLTDVIQKSKWSKNDFSVQGLTVESYRYDDNPKLRLSFLNFPCGAHDQLSAAPFTSLQEVMENGASFVSRKNGYSSSINAESWRHIYRDIMMLTQPEKIYTLDPDQSFPVRLSKPEGEGSHPDHVMVARMATQAVEYYGRPVALFYYLDYPLYTTGMTLNATDGAAKHRAMDAYCYADTTACNRVIKPNTFCAPATDLPWGEAWLCRQQKRMLPIPVRQRDIIE